MKILKTISLFVVIITALLAFPSPVFAQAPDGDGKVVFGGSYELKSGETLSGDLAVFGGTAVVEKGATVDGDIFIMGGYLEVSGKVAGDLVAIGGNIKLSGSSVVEQNLTTINATVQRDPGAKIKGNTTVETPGSFDLRVLPFLDTLRIEQGSARSAMNLNLLKPIGDFLWILFKAFGLAALAVILMLFFEKPTNRITHTMVTQPLIAGGFGLLTIIVAPALLLLLAITIVLLPVSLVGILILAAAFLYGWIAAGFEVGKRLSQFLKWQCAAPACAGMGTLVMTIVVTMVGWIPCIGWLASALILMWGLGGVLITRFGTAKTTPEPAMPDNTVPPAGFNPVNT